MRVNKNVVFILLIVTLQFVFSTTVVQHINDQRTPFVEPDSAGYADTTRYFLGQADRSPIINYRLFSPVIPFLAAILSPLCGVIPAYLLLNYVFLLLASFVLFVYFRNVLFSRLHAQLATILFATSMPVIMWAPCVLVDMGSWFGISVLLLYTSRPFKPKSYDLIFQVLLYGLVVLIKPTLAFIVLFAGAYRFFFKKQHLTTILAGAGSALVVLCVYLSLDLSLEYFTMFGLPRHRHVLLAGSAFAFAFSSLIPFGFIGVAAYKSLRGELERSIEGFYIMNLIYLACSLAVFLIFVHAARLAFIMYPIVLTSSIFGFEYLSKKTKTGNKLLVLLTALCVLFSNLTAFIYRSDMLLSIGKSLVGTSWS